MAIPGTADRLPGFVRAGLAALISGAGLLVLLFLFEPFLSRHAIVNIDFGCWLGLGCITLAVVFGGMAWHSKLAGSTHQNGGSR